MTAEKLHDAITLLPGDLVIAADRLRTVPRTRTIHWKRWISLAACLVLLLGAGLVLRQLPGMGAKTESVAAPMAPQITMENAIAGAPAEEAAPMEPADAAGIQGESALEKDAATNHSHRYAEPSDSAPEIPSGFSGESVTRIFVDGQEFALQGGDSAAVADILENLDYAPERVCRCMAEFTVDTERLKDIHVNLTQGFARCSLGQAALTQAQAELIRDIVNNLR